MSKKNMLNTLRVDLLNVNQMDDMLKKNDSFDVRTVLKVILFAIKHLLQLQITHIEKRGE